MFVKGMKYELRSVARIVVPMLIMFLCVTMIMSLGFMLDGRVFHFTEKAEGSDNLFAVLFVLAEALLAFGVMILIIVINVADYVLIVYRFYVSFFTDEGYLTFTLPVSINCHLMVKIASMFFWSLATLLVTMLGGLIVFGGVSVGYPEAVENSLSEFSYFFDMIWVSLTPAYQYIGAQIAVGGLTLLATGIFQSLLVYFAVCLGCMLFKKHRLLGAIVGIFGVNAIYSFVSTIGSYILTFFSVVSEIAYLVTMGFTFVLTVAGIIGVYVAMRYILQKKLNLD